jgi:hypothetical protein
MTWLSYESAKKSALVMSIVAGVPATRLGQPMGTKSRIRIAR